MKTTMKAAYLCLVLHHSEFDLSVSVHNHFTAVCAFCYLYCLLFCQTTASFTTYLLFCKFTEAFRIVTDHPLQEK